MPPNSLKVRHCRARSAAETQGCKGRFHVCVNFERYTRYAPPLRGAKFPLAGHTYAVRAIEVKHDGHRGMCAGQRAVALAPSEPLARKLFLRRNICRLWLVKVSALGKVSELKWRSRTGSRGFSSHNRQDVEAGMANVKLLRYMPAKLP